MKLSNLFFLCAGIISLSTAVASATTISDFTGVVTSASPTQTGRLSRNGVAQTWTGAESYPGVINTATTYYYQTYTFAASLFTGGPYVEISEFSEANLAGTFVSAYANAYLPDSAGTPNFGFNKNWLGDEGSSGNLFGTDASYFDIYLPPGSSLVLVLSTTAAGTGGLNDKIDLTVDSYSDTMYDDPIPVTNPPSAVPEPSSLVLLGTGALTMAGAVRRRLMRKA